MSAEYDDQNIFAKILRGEIPNDTVAENEHALAFHDIQPQAPVHVLVIPKGAYIDYGDFAAHASDAEITGFHRLVAKVVADKNLGPQSGGQGFRAVSNAGEHGVQDVPHFHLHLLGGHRLGPMLSKR